MEKTRRFTILSLLEPNRTGPTITRVKPARWYHRRTRGLSDRLLASAVQWPLDSTGLFRKNLMYTSF